MEWQTDQSNKEKPFCALQKVTHFVEYFWFQQKCITKQLNK